MFYNNICMKVSHKNNFYIVIEISGCRHACDNCYSDNIAHIKNEITTLITNNIIELVNMPDIIGVIIKCGDTFFSNNYTDIKRLTLVIKEYCKKVIYLHTCDEWEDVKSSDILKHIDYVICGKFKNSLIHRFLNFKHSANQKIIDVKLSLSKNKIVISECKT